MFESVLNLPRKFTDKKIPPNDAVWFNDNLMAGAHRLFCRSLGHPSSYQSVLTWQKSVSHIFESKRGAYTVVPKWSKPMTVAPLVK